MIDKPPPTTEALPKRYMPLPTADAVLAMYEAMIGRAMTQEENVALRTKFAALEARRARDRARVDGALPASACSRSVATRDSADSSLSPPALRAPGNPGKDFDASENVAAPLSEARERRRQRR